MQNYVVCNSCGKGFTYTDEDFRKNTGKAALNVLSSLGQIAGAVSGNWGGAIANKLNETELRDFSRCPHCGSHDLRYVTEEEFQRSQKKLAGGGPAVSINANASVDALIKRTTLLMEDQEWDTAEVYCGQILDLDPERGEVYLLLALIENKTESPKVLADRNIDIRISKHYKNIMRFGDEALLEQIHALNETFDRKRLEEKQAKEKEQREKERLKKEKEEREREEQYLSAVNKSESEDVSLLREALSSFSALGQEYRDAAKYAESCKQKIEKIEAAKQRKAKKVFVLSASAVVLCLAIVLLITKVILPSQKYKDAVALANAGEYDYAIVAFEELNGYKDSEEQIISAKTAKEEEERRAKEAQIEAENTAAYDRAKAKLAAGDYDGAEEIFSSLGSFSDAEQMVLQTQEARLNSQYQSAVDFLAIEEYEEAYNLFIALGDYSGSTEQAKQAAVLLAEKYLSQDEPASAIEWYKTGEKQDTAHQLEYEYITNHFDNHDELTYGYLLELIDLGYPNAQKLYDKLYKVSFSAYINYNPYSKKASNKNLTKIPSSEGDPYFYFCFSGGYPGQTINVELFEQSSLDYLNYGRWGYSPEHHYLEVTTDEWHTFGFSHIGSNVYEHRVTVINSDTGEQLGVFSVSTPYR